MSNIKRICCQSGHWNMTSGATGAPMEQVRTLAIGLKLVDLLRANGFEVYHTDAFADSNPAVTNKDWDLFLSLHCDANYAGDEGGGFFNALILFTKKVPIVYLYLFAKSKVVSIF